MGFADFYFEKYQAEQGFITDNPDTNLEIIITIPCFKEENILKALDGLYLCEPTKNAVEILVFVNFPEGREDLYQEKHYRLFDSIQDWTLRHTLNNLKFFVFVSKLPAKTAGVGHARKVAMDEALRRFNQINNPDGIIVGFDSDCTCDANYLVEIENHFLKNPKTTGCSIYFEHPVSGNEHPQIIYDAIIQYELYLRYYIEAARWAGFPFAFHTLGSSFAVRAGIYSRQGGMNKRKAGEDFYFLHKIIPLGNYFEINNTRVIPSPRESDRVPFGTGASIEKIIRSNSPVYFTYNPEAFECLKDFFNESVNFFKQPIDVINNFIGNNQPAIIEFLERNNFEKNIVEINSNCSNISAFLKRFYSWFNGLMVLQFLNQSHNNPFKRIPVSEAASIILQRRGIETANSGPLDLLDTYRKLQKENNFAGKI